MMKELSPSEDSHFSEEGSEDRAAGPERQRCDNEVFDEFAAATSRLIEHSAWHIEEAERDGFEPCYDASIEATMAGLKLSNKRIGELIRALEAIKRMQAHRLKLLKGVADLFRPGRQGELD